MAWAFIADLIFDRLDVVLDGLRFVDRALLRVGRIRVGLRIA